MHSLMIQIQTNAKTLGGIENNCKLKGQSHQTEVAPVSIEVLSSGVPQGLGLGPILFLLLFY